MLLYLAKEVFLHFLHIKAYVVLTIMFICIQNSTQQFQMIKKNESYEEYLNKNIPNGYLKLNLKQFYDCYFNSEYRKLPENKADYSVAKHNSTIMEWCESNFVPWIVYKERYTGKLLVDRALELKSCLGNDIVDMLKNCFSSSSPVTPHNVKVKIECINEKLDTDERKKKFKTCLREFQMDMYFVRKDIRIDPRTLSVLKSTIDGFDDRKTRHFYEYKKNTEHKNLAEKKKCNEYLDEINLFKNRAIEMEKCLDEKSKLILQRCAGNYQSTKELQKNETEISKCIIKGFKDEKIQWDIVQKCIDDFERRKKDRYTANQGIIQYDTLLVLFKYLKPDVQNLNLYETSQIFYEYKKKKSVHKDLEDFNKCQDENHKMKSLNNEVNILISCIGIVIKSIVYQCIAQESKQINQCLNEDLVASEKSRLLKCSFDFEQKVSEYEHRSSIKGQRTATPFAEETGSLMGSRYLREVLIEKNIVQPKKGNVDTLHYSTVYIISKLTMQNEIYPEDLYKNYTGFKPIHWYDDEMNKYKNKLLLSAQQFNTYLKDYQRFPKQDETFEQYRDRIINPKYQDLKNQKNVKIPYKTEVYYRYKHRGDKERYISLPEEEFLIYQQGLEEEESNVFRGDLTKDKFNLLKSDDINTIEAEYYMTYVLRIKNHDEHIPFTSRIKYEEQSEQEKKRVHSKWTY